MPVFSGIFGIFRPFAGTAAIREQPLKPVEPRKITNFSNPFMIVYLLLSFSY
jgi:hypothetical protein